MLGEIRVRDLGAGLEHADLQTCGGKLPGRDSARSAGTHYDYVVNVPVPGNRL